MKIFDEFCLQSLDRLGSELIYYNGLDWSQRQVAWLSIEMTYLDVDVERLLREVEYVTNYARRRRLRSVLSDASRKAKRSDELKAGDVGLKQALNDTKNALTEAIWHCYLLRQRIIEDSNRTPAEREQLSGNQSPPNTPKRSAGRAKELHKRVLIGKALDNGKTTHKEIKRYVQNATGSDSTVSPKRISEVKESRKNG